MNKTLDGIGIETVSMIFQIGNTMTPRSQFLVSLVVTDKGDSSDLLDKLNALNTRDFCHTQWIGTRYIKDVSSEQFGPLLDSQRTGTQSSLQYPAGEWRPFLTSTGRVGIASREIQERDLVCAITSVEYVYRLTKKLCIILRPKEYSERPSFILVGRTILLVPGTTISSFVILGQIRT